MPEQAKYVYVEPDDPLGLGMDISEWIVYEAYPFVDHGQFQTRSAALEYANSISTRTGKPISVLDEEDEHCYV